jgi:hypothetical protein
MWIVSTIFSSIAKIGTFIWKQPLKTHGATTSSKRYKSILNPGKSGELYAFVLNRKRTRFKVGKSINVAQRIRSYKTTQPDGYLLHTVRCDDIDRAEHLLHNLLKLKGHHVTQEIFSLADSMLIAYMNLVTELCRSIQRIENPEKLSKITHFLRKTSN